MDWKDLWRRAGRGLQGDYSRKSSPCPSERKAKKTIDASKEGRLKAGDIRDVRITGIAEYDLIGTCVT